MADFQNPSVENKLIIAKRCGVFLKNILWYGISKKIKRSHALNTGMPLVDFYQHYKCRPKGKGILFHPILVACKTTEQEQKRMNKKTFSLIGILLIFFLSYGANAQKNTAETYRQLDLFGDVFERVRTEYVKQVNDVIGTMQLLRARCRNQPALL